MTYNYLRTSEINGQHAYRGWDGLWYVFDQTGWTGETFETREHAVAAMRAC